MKRLIMILMAFVTIHATAQEQNSELQQQRQRTHATPEEVAQIQTQRMSKSLELSEAQQKGVYDLLLQRNKMRQTKKEAFIEAKKNSKENGISKADRLKMKEEHVAQQAELQNQMKTILSPEQLTKWEEVTARQTQNRKNMQGNSIKRKHNRKQH